MGHCQIEQNMGRCFPLGKFAEALPQGFADCMVRLFLLFPCPPPQFGFCHRVAPNLPVILRTQSQIGRQFLGYLVRSLRRAISSAERR